MAGMEGVVGRFLEAAGNVILGWTSANKVPVVAVIECSRW